MRAAENFFAELGRTILFLKELFHVARSSKLDRQTLLEQIYKVTTQSMTNTVFSGFFIGAIMSVQFGTQLREFSALSVLGGLATSATIRELGPLLIAFMLSGKVGAYTSAELGTMRVTEQIDAMRCLGANPIQFLILPRFIAIVVSSFFLLLAGLLASVFGGIVLGLVVAHIGPFEYINGIPTFVTGTSIVSGIYKCFVFSFVLATICTYKGYTTTGGAKGVGRTVIATSLYTMVSIVLLDWFTSYTGRAFATIWEGLRG